MISQQCQQLQQQQQQQRWSQSRQQRRTAYQNCARSSSVHIQGLNNLSDQNWVLVVLLEAVVLLLPQAVVLLRPIETAYMKTI